ncbi:MAG: hypothetical protein L0227_15230 [Chloroflexi bacterium]|nr:hypothetical protein [Chloroflexota bacterium]
MGLTVGVRSDEVAPPEAIGGGPRRVRYVERMVLSAADLAADDAYRTSARRRHDLAGHDWGIVFGLALIAGDGGSTVRLQPGVAIDGFGREIIVADPVDVDRSWAGGQAGPGGVDVWLTWARAPIESAHSGRWDCGPGRNDRWRDEPLLRVTPATATPDAWSLVPESALAVAPGGSSRDEPGQVWPVFLGRIDPSGTPDPTGRIYAALRGEAVVAASGSARLTLGSDAADPNLRFAVAVPDAGGAFADRLTIDRDGNSTIRGRLRVLDGDVLLTSSGGEAPRDVGACDRAPDQESIDAQWIGPALMFPVVSTPAASASPWAVYRVSATEAGRPRIDQLSFETGAPEGNEDPARYRLAVGTAVEVGEERGFRPCLTVDAGCAVRVAGKLVVTGKLSHGPLRANPADPTFVEALTLAWMIGVEAARPAAEEPEIIT